MLKPMVAFAAQIAALAAGAIAGLAAIAILGAAGLAILPAALVLYGLGWRA